MKGVCMHCGAGPDIHRYETQQCPVGGVEQSRDNYLTTVYEEDRTDPLKEQIKKLESRVTFLEGKIKVIMHAQLHVIMHAQRHVSHSDNP